MTFPAHPETRYGLTRLTSVITVLVNSPQNFLDSKRRSAGRRARRQLSALQPQTPDGRLKLFLREVWARGSADREASAPSPRLAKPFQRRHEFLPPVRALSASIIASRAWIKVGRQGWLGWVLRFGGFGYAVGVGTYSFMPLRTSWRARKRPSVGTPFTNVGLRSSVMPSRKRVSIYNVLIWSIIWR